MSRLRSLAAFAAVMLTGAAVAYATYGDRPTAEQIRKAKGPISSIVEINRRSTTGVGGVVYAAEKPHEIYMNAAIVGLTPGADVRVGFTREGCAKEPGRVIRAFATTVEGPAIHYLNVIRTRVDELARSITLRARALRVFEDGVQVGCGPVIVLRLTNEDPNP